MSAAGSERGHESEPEIVEAERDDRETAMAFGPGKMPWYVVIVWIGVLVAYAIYMVTYALPDYRTY